MKLKMLIVCAFQVLCLTTSPSQELNTAHKYVLGLDSEPGSNLSSVKSWPLERVVGHSNVRSYGAVGDGIADDTAAIQSAIDSTDSDTVFIPRGTYRLTRVLTIPRGGISIIGDGMNKTIIVQSSSTSKGIEVSFNGARELKFIGFTLKGTGGNTHSGAGFNLYSPTGPGTQPLARVIFEHIGCVEFETGILASRIPQLLMMDCSFAACKTCYDFAKVDTGVLINCAGNGRGVVGGKIYTATGVTCLRNRHGLSGGAENMDLRIIGGEWGNADTVLDMQSGVVRWLGGNIESITGDVVFNIGPAPSHFYLQAPRMVTSNDGGGTNAIIRVQGTGRGDPKITIIGSRPWTNRNWRDIELVKPYNNIEVVNMAQAGMKCFWVDTPGGIPKMTKEVAHYNTKTSEWYEYNVPNTDVNNRKRLGRMLCFGRNDGVIGDENLVYFYKTRLDSAKRVSLLNDLLIDVLHTDSSLRANDSSGETHFELFDLPPRSLGLSGDVLTFNAFGRFAHNDRMKRMQVMFSNEVLFDSGEYSVNGEGWKIDMKLVRSDKNNMRVLVEYSHGDQKKMDVKSISLPNGNLDKVFHKLSMVLSASNASDIVIYSTRIQWEKSDKKY